MADSGGPLDRLRNQNARRLRLFTVYHAAMVVVALAVLGWILLGSADPTFVWAFVAVFAIMGSGVPLVWWMNRWSFQRTIAGLDAFRARVVDAKLSLNYGYLLILDGGMILGIDARRNTLRFLRFISAGGASLRPDMAQAERWGMRLRGMATAGAISAKRGAPEAQAQLDRFRAAFGAKWYMAFLRRVKTDRLVAGDPMLHEIVAFYVPKWWEHARSVAQELDALASFMEEAPARYFPPETPAT